MSDLTKLRQALSGLVPRDRSDPEQASVLMFVCFVLLDIETQACVGWDDGCKFWLCFLSSLLPRGVSVIQTNVQGIFPPLMTLVNEPQKEF